ncbi:MAG: hypothetical protein HUJ29_09560 [Gammaproteobacteria bacterium]|nr:hypothetical protein [Gammaproteobacteria bacterium]
MEIDFSGGNYTYDQNGDRQAKFYRCSDCGDLLAVGCYIDGDLRGAVSVALFGETYHFGEPVNIQPWRLSSKDKLERWGKLWGMLYGIK